MYLLVLYLLFWNHILIWFSVNRKEMASRDLSSLERYLKEQKYYEMRISGYLWIWKLYSNDVHCFYNRIASAFDRKARINRDLKNSFVVVLAQFFQRGFSTVVFPWRQHEMLIFFHGFFPWQPRKILQIVMETWHIRYNDKVDPLDHPWKKF